MISINIRGKMNAEELDEERAKNSEQDLAILSNYDNIGLLSGRVTANEAQIDENRGNLEVLAAKIDSAISDLDIFPLGTIKPTLFTQRRFQKVGCCVTGAQLLRVSGRERRLPTSMEKDAS